MANAAEDPKTRAHESAKDKAFGIAALLGVLLIVVGIWFMSLGGLWILLGVFLAMLGGAFGFAAVAGWLMRNKARKVMRDRPWLITPVRLLARPPAGRKGRVLIELPDAAVQLAITGPDDRTIEDIKRDREMEYVGDLHGTGMVFVRLSGGDAIFPATVRPN